MSALARPGVLALLLVAAALLVHPLVAASAWLPAHELATAAALLLVVVGLLAQAARAGAAARGPAWLVACGLALAVVAAGADRAVGRDGRLSLAVGQSRGHFEERGPGGRSLGLRPLGFVVGVEGVTTQGAARLVVVGEEQPVEVPPGGSVALRGFRFAQPVLSTTGGVGSLRVSASDGAQTFVADLVPGEPATLGDTQVRLEQYFPDFALDERQQPFSRSNEPRNPAALLTVERGGQSHRAFVIQAMPGVHRVEPLGLSFSLLQVQAERAVQLSVHREPFALLALVGGLLALAGLAWWLATVPPRVARAGEGHDLLGVALGALALALVATGRGALLGWTLVVPASAGSLVPLAGAGVALGVALLASLAGALLLAADAVSGGAGARPLARGASWLAVGAGALGIALALLRAWQLPSGLTAGGTAPLLGLALGVALLAVALRAPRVDAGAAAFGATALTVIVLVGAIAAGVAGVRAQGTYATEASAAGAAATLLGLAALQPTAAFAWRGLALVLAALLRLARPL